jgi:hypothetical protein
MHKQTDKPRLNGRLLAFIAVIAILFACLGQAISRAPVSVRAQGPAAPPERTTSLKVAYTLYEWWLLNWTNNTVSCQIYIEHQGLPTRQDVYYFCGQTVLNQWVSTPPCDFTNTTSCTGLYLHRAHVTPGEREIQVKLPPPAVYVSLSGCSTAAPYNRCEKLPELVLTGEEPLPNEAIIRIQGFMNGEPFSCAGNNCVLPLPPTSSTGIPFEFWADSSFGDSSEHFKAQVRAVPWGDFTNPELKTSDAPLWYVDVISSQWRGAPVARCSQVWSSFPDVGGPPPWLYTPDRPEDLRSNASYYYLAGSLIGNGEVDASSCGDGGLQSPGVASVCGLEKAQPKVVEWQNRFDTEIIQVARDAGIPAQLMKNVFSRESQFWPGMFTTYKEAGLGQLTENGADTVLLWNPNFFSQFCPLIYENRVCQNGFGNLNTDQQAILRGALVRKVNSACPSCPAGIDLTQATFSISVFARSLLANCEQVGQILYDSTLKQAGQVSNYVDLWRFTLVNYNAGSGCLANAVQASLDLGQPLDWANVSSHLEPACQGAISYIDDISTVPGAPTPTPTVLVPGAVTPTPGGLPPTPTPRATSTPLPSGTRTPTPTVSATVPGYNPPGGTPEPTLTPGEGGYY